jgi:hypothetical protein
LVEKQVAKFKHRRNFRTKEQTTQKQLTEYGFSAKMIALLPTISIWDILGDLLTSRRMFDFV